MNSRTWVPKASTLLLDYRSRSNNHTTGDVIPVHPMKKQGNSRTTCSFGVMRERLIRCPTYFNFSYPFSRKSRRFQRIYRLKVKIHIQDVEAPRFKDNRHKKVIIFLRITHRPALTPEIIPGTQFCYSLSRPQSHREAGSITSMKNSIDTIGDRTRDLPAYSAVSQLTAPSRAPCPQQFYRRSILFQENGSNPR